MQVSGGNGGSAQNYPASPISESEARPGVALAIPDGEAGMTGLDYKGNGLPGQPGDAMMLDIDWVSSTMKYMPTPV